LKDLSEKAKLLRESGFEDEKEKPYVFINRNGVEAISIPALREHIKQNNIIRFYQGSFKMYSDGYYKTFDMPSFVYMEIPEHLRSNKIAEQVTLDLQLDTDLLINDKDVAGGQYICFKNGVYDLKTRELTKHSSDRIFVSQIPHNYNPNAAPDEITESFLQNCCGSDVQQRKLLLEMIGVTLSDVRSFKYWFFIQGAKDTGKSTFCGLLQKLLTDVDGTKHYSALPLNALDEDEFGLAEVLGKKANIVTDTANDPIKNLTTIKKLTGGAYEELNCKVKYGIKTAKGVSKAILIFAGNDIPMLWTKGDKTAFLERMILLRFGIVVAKQNQIAGLVDKLDYEYLIRIGVETLHEFIDNNYVFTEPESVVENRQDVLFESDNIYKFFRDACSLTKGECFHIAEAYQIFMYWCFENGYSEKINQNQITVNTFRSSIIEYGAGYKRSERIGKAVKPAFMDFTIDIGVYNAYYDQMFNTYNPNKYVAK
jgi:P4 family phage/plasmid primase-like protien